MSFPVFLLRFFGAVAVGMAPVFFTLGLMAKPMLVMLRFVLSFPDYWPRSVGAVRTAKRRGLTILPRTGRGNFVCYGLVQRNRKYSSEFVVGIT